MEQLSLWEDGEIEESSEPRALSLVEQFGFTPFSVLRGDTSALMDRNRKWTAMGVQSELGSSARTFHTDDANDSDFYRKKERSGSELTGKQFMESDLYDKPEYGGLSQSGVSVFSAALCEMAYTWFTADGDSVLDPFAGGSIRGIIASRLNRNYTGIELRKEQVESNIEQGAKVCKENQPKWIVGDSADMDSLVNGEFDFIFTCPPYGNLEVYSDIEGDLSNMADADFDAAYTKIIGLAADRLRDDRFAAIVVGNYRDKNGYLRDLVGLTVRAMEQSGLHYYNDMVFVTPVGSLSYRAKGGFISSRKIGKQHQYMLVFVKGNPKEATARLGDVIVADSYL